MATHSSVLAWRIPGMGSHRVGHDLSDLAVLTTSATWKAYNVITSRYNFWEVIWLEFFFFFL